MRDGQTDLEGNLLGANGFYENNADFRKFKNKVFRLPLVYYFDFDTPGLEKPWN